MRAVVLLSSLIVVDDFEKTIKKFRENPEAKVLLEKSAEEIHYIRMCIEVLGDLERTPRLTLI